MIKILCGFLIMSLSLVASNLTEAMDKAQTQKKLILVELVMESCSYCEKMEKFVLSKEEVKNRLDRHYVFLKLDINKDEIPELLTSRMTPTFYFVSSDASQVLYEVQGAASKSEFVTLLERFEKK
ncbi:thioredoxin family protein [Sulfurospirillum oryzae]|uniref:thioredoxin family protein n=1 Tax=Sulfurospirillum oryzae TaxID=2976535 RepID=UPI0021E91D20|nr:thioredoxin family protein [Sulfurospirillum oryzae]